jgi:Helix-turn-helix domain
MSIEATNAVWRYSRQKSGNLLVLLALADYTNNDGIAWPAVSTLALKARMSKRNAQRCGRALEKAGELQICQNQGRKGSNIYRILLRDLRPNSPEGNDIHDAGVAKTMSPASSKGDTSVTESVNKPLIEPPPIVPKGDETEFWIKVCFRCFEQPVHPVRPHVLRALCFSIAAVDKDHANSLIEFYQTESLDSKEPPYSSRRHSPERLILDLPRQLALAIKACPPARPPKKYNFTIQEVHDYLSTEYPGCILPRSLDDLDHPSWGHIRAEVYDAMRKRHRTNVDGT